MAWVKALVIGMGVLLVVGFVVIAVTLANRMTSAGAGVAAEARVALAPDERLVEARLDGARIMFRIAGASGERIEVRALADGAMIARFEIGAAGG
jgi:hypothetical protein